MLRTFVRFALLAAAAWLAGSPPDVRAGNELVWTNWEPGLFARAKAENRFVLLDLEAVWCHWCHVMDETTYHDPKVVALIQSRYIPVRVDQDGSPDLSSRYGDWGWPATIVLGPDGTEIVKLRGYRPPEQMASMLQAVIDDPSPGPSAFSLPEVEPAASAYLSLPLRTRLLAEWKSAFDVANAGWGTGNKLIITDSMDLALNLASAGDSQAEQMARRTFDQALNLIDPVWGGVYQYSDEADWKSPHFEKIMAYQASYLRQLSEAYARWDDPRYREAASAIRGYLDGFLKSRDGAFYVSQDADLDAQTDGHKFYALDDAGRRRLGLPRVDTHIYARENGWAISGLVAFYAATGDAGALATAVRAFDWVAANRALPGGGFRHDSADRSGPYLGDTLAMGQAALDLYAATGNRSRLATAADAGNFIGANLRSSSGGFLTSKTAEAAAGLLTKPVIQFDETVAATRFLNLLARYTGRTEFGDLARHAMRYLASGVITAIPGYDAGVLLADAEMAIEPMHVTVIGSKSDPDAITLHRAALRIPSGYRRIDWWDRAEGPMANADVQYPELDRPAAFACSNRVCSLPVLEQGVLLDTIRRMLELRREERGG